MPKLESQALLRISQLDLTKNLHQILEEILTIVGEELGAPSGSILLLKEETAELEMVATIGLPEDYIERAYSKGVQKLGGEIIVPKQEVPGMGYFALALDPEGNIFGLWEEKAAPK